jgi:hypothetical protein
MPVCLKCNKMMPPDLMVEVKENIRLCKFCNDNVEFFIIDNDDGTFDKVTRNDVVNEYQILLKKLYEKRSIKDIVDGTYNKILDPGRIIIP